MGSGHVYGPQAGGCPLALLGVTCLWLWACWLGLLSQKLHLPGRRGCQVFLVLSFWMGLLPALTGLSSAPQPGDMKSDPKNNCTFFSCVKIHNQLISSVSNITCPDFDPTTCLPVSGLARALAMCALPGLGVSKDLGAGPQCWGSGLCPGSLLQELPLPTPGGLGSQAHSPPHSLRAPSPSCPTAAARNVSTRLTGGLPGPLQG